MIRGVPSWRISWYFTPWTNQHTDTTVFVTSLFTCFHTNTAHFKSGLKLVSIRVGSSRTARAEENTPAGADDLDVASVWTQLKRFVRRRLSASALVGLVLVCRRGSPLVGPVRSGAGSSGPIRSCPDGSPPGSRVCRLERCWRCFDEELVPEDEDDQRSGKRFYTHSTFSRWRIRPFLFYHALPNRAKPRWNKAQVT